MTPEDKFNVKMAFSFCKAGSENDAWVLTNNFNNMDYAQLVILQKALIEKLGNLFTDFGIIQAQALGFDMQKLNTELENALASVKANRENKNVNAKPGTFGSPGASPKR